MSTTTAKPIERISFDLDALLEDTYQLVVFNDDVNTFDHVIEVLVKYCDHQVIQAEQCAYIVHYNGKCIVKKGDMDTLKPIRVALTDAGLSAKII